MAILSPLDVIRSTLPLHYFQGDYEGGLLGVVGTDVALPELEDSVPNGEVTVVIYNFSLTFYLVYRE